MSEIRRYPRRWKRDTSAFRGCHWEQRSSDGPVLFVNSHGEWLSEFDMNESGIYETYEHLPPIVSTINGEGVFHSANPADVALTGEEEGAENLYRVERRFSNGCEVCPQIWRGDKWIADIPGAPYLGKDGLIVANEIVEKVNGYDRLAADVDRLTRELAAANQKTFDAIDALAKQRAESFEERESLLNRVLTWIDSDNRKPAIMAFTSGVERQIADRFETANARADKALAAENADLRTQLADLRTSHASEVLRLMTQIAAEKGRAEKAEASCAAMREAMLMVDIQTFNEVDPQFPGVRQIDRIVALQGTRNFKTQRDAALASTAGRDLLAQREATAEHLRLLNGHCHDVEADRDALLRQLADVAKAIGTVYPTAALATTSNAGGNA